MFRTFQARADSKRAFFDGSAFVGAVRTLSFEAARTIADDFAFLFAGVISRQQHDRCRCSLPLRGPLPGAIF
jgi:hypothetical protein